MTSVPQMTPTPRYLISWWPIFVLALVWSMALYNKYLPYKLGFVIPILYFAFVYSATYNILFDHSAYNAQISQNKELISQIQNENLRYCVGGYWDIGPIMYISKLEIKCWTDKTKHSGWSVSYLDDYKRKFSDQSIFLVEP